MKLTHWQSILLIVVCSLLGIVGLWSTPALARDPLALDEFPASPGERSQAPRAEGVSLSMQPSLVDCVRPGQVVTFTFTFSSSAVVPDGGEFRITDPDGNVVLEQLYPFIPPMPTVIPPPINYVSSPISFTVPVTTGLYLPKISIFAPGLTVPFEASFPFRVRYCGNLEARKFEDRNGNGVRDAGEPPISGWSMTVMPPPGSNPPPGNAFWTRATDVNGVARWNDLGLGVYTVTEQARPWWIARTPSSASVEISAGTTRTVLFGNQNTGNLIVCKFVDVNGNHLKDANEPFQSGWGMTVDPPAGYVWLFPRTQRTGPDGCAYWNNIPAGTYTITEEDRSALNWTLTTPPNPKTGVGVSQGANPPVFFGNQVRYSIQGQKTDQYGSGLANWTIHARPCGATAPVLTAVTDANGNYSLSGPELTVPPTCWTVWEEMKPGWTPLTPSSRNVQCTPAGPAPDAHMPGDVKAIITVFLPMIFQSTNPVQPATPACDRADFRNQMPAFHPKGVAVNPRTHRIYAGVQGVNQVLTAEVDRTNPLQPVLNADDSPIPVGNGPFGIAVNEVTNEIYVANFNGNSLSVIDGATNKVSQTISLAPFAEPTFVGIYTDTNRIYVPLHANGKLAVVDGATKALVKTIDVGAGAFGLAIDRANCRAYVSSRDALWISVVNICPGIEEVIPGQLIRLGPPGLNPHYEPFALALDGGLAKLNAIVHPYPDPPKTVNAEQAWTYALPIAALAPLGMLTPPQAVTSLERGGDQSGIGIVANPGTHNIFVTNLQDNSIACFNGERLPANARRLAQTYDGRAFAGPMMAAVDPAYGYVYVSSHYGSPEAGIRAWLGILLDSPALCP